MDDCGVCGGDNSGCRTMKGVFEHSDGEGYHFVVEIPAGSTNIVIEQKSAYSTDEDDSNYLGRSHNFFGSGYLMSTPLVAHREEFDGEAVAGAHSNYICLLGLWFAVNGSSKLCLYLARICSWQP